MAAAGAVGQPMIAGRKHIIGAAIFVLEAIGFFVVVAVHLGAAVDVPGYVQPRGPVAVVAGLCGLALAGAATASVRRLPAAWEIGIGAHIACVAGMLVIDKALAVTDATPIYRIGIGVTGLVGILLMSSVGKSALGREDSGERG